MNICKNPLQPLTPISSLINTPFQPLKPKTYSYWLIIENKLILSFPFPFPSASLLIKFFNPQMQYWVSTSLRLSLLQAFMLLSKSIYSDLISYSNAKKIHIFPRKISKNIDFYGKCKLKYLLLTKCFSNKQ